MGASTADHGQSTRSAERKRTLRRKGQVEAEQGHQRGQHAAQADQLRPIDRHFEADFRQIGRGAILHRLIDRRGHFLAPAAEQEEIDQAVAQRRLALLDRGGGEDRIDAVQQRRQQVVGEVGPRRGDQSQPAEQPPPEPQSADHEPMVGQRGRKQVAEHADGQRDQSVGDVDPFDPAAGLVQAVVDEGFVLGRRRRDEGRVLRRRLRG